MAGSALAALINHKVVPDVADVVAHWRALGRWLTRSDRRKGQRQENDHGTTNDQRQQVPAKFLPSPLPDQPEELHDRDATGVEPR